MLKWTSKWWTTVTFLNLNTYKEVWCLQQCKVISSALNIPVIIDGKTKRQMNDLRTFQTEKAGHLAAWAWLALAEHRIMLELNIHWALSIPRKVKQTKRVQDSPTVKNAFGIRLLDPPRPQGPSGFTASGVWYPHVVEKIISTEMYLVMYNQKEKKKVLFSNVYFPLLENMEFKTIESNRVSILQSSYLDV